MSRAAGPGRRPVTEVAVGVLVRSDGAVLLADRPAGKPYAGHWEFPGGKIEDGETVEHALARELHEELGLRVLRSDPWAVMEYDYPHAYVRLHFRRVFDWSGTPHPVEGQRLEFLVPGAPPPAPLLPAAGPALRWIELATVCGFSPGTAGDAALALAWIDAALGRGLQQIVWHEPRLDQAQLAAALAACAARAQAHGARLLVDARSAARAGAPVAGAGIHLGVDELRRCAARPDADWVGAGVAQRSDLEHAAAIGCDFAVCENGAANDGLAAWRELCAASPLPLYVAQDLSAESLDRARRGGAHGLALRGLPGAG